MGVQIETGREGFVRRREREREERARGSHGFILVVFRAEFVLRNTRFFLVNAFGYLRNDVLVLILVNFFHARNVFSFEVFEHGWVHLHQERHDGRERGERGVEREMGLNDNSVATGETGFVLGKNLRNEEKIHEYMRER